jgi:hypothetical protein
MNYRKELLKRLFQKLGKQSGETDGEKQKSIKMSTTISAHDLENKKRQAIGFLKKSPVLKLYIKVNKYDPDNVQKGRLMLMNIAEDLKSYAKIKVSPVEVVDVPKEPEKPKEKQQVPTGFNLPTEKDQEDLDKVKMAMSLKDKKDDEDAGLEHVYMELESTVCFGDYDIDSLIENTTLEEFLANLYKGGLPVPGQVDTDLKGEDKVDEAPRAGRPQLEFSADEEEQKAMFSKAQERIKLKRKLRKRSAIFDTSEDAAKEAGVIDLTSTVALDEDAEEMSDYDLLKANINPLDLDTLRRVNALRTKVEFEQT